MPWPGDYFYGNIPGILPSVFGYPLNSATVSGVIVVGAYDINTSGGNTTFKFKGKFEDTNKSHNFRVSYTNSGQSVNHDFIFSKVKSLYLLTPSSSINISVPSNNIITATRCVSQNFTISFPNVQFANESTPTTGYGSVTTYEYNLPIGWVLNGITSTGSNWITGTNNVVVTSDLSNGDGIPIKVRPVNSCGANLQRGREVSISVTRPNSLNISGPPTICTSENYTINLPAGATVTWSATGSISVPPGSTGSSVTATSNGSGSGILTASITSACGNATITKPVSAGLIPVLPVFLSEGDIIYVDLDHVYADVCPNPNLSNTVKFFLPGEEVQNLEAFAYDGGIYPPQVIQTNKVYWYYPPGSYSITMRLEYDTSCGHITQYITFYDICNENYSYTVYPNPVNDQITVGYKNDSGQNALSERKKLQRRQFEVKLVDNKGKVLRTMKNSSEANSIVLDTRDIPNGTYFLHITEGKNSVKKQIIIQH